MKIKFMLVMLLLIPFATATISPDTQLVDKEWTIGSSVLSPTTVTFTSSDGANQSVALSLEGDISQVVSLNPTTLEFTNSSLVKSTTMTYLLNQTTIPKLYKGKLKYGAESISLFLNVLSAAQNNSVPENEDDCKLKPVTASNFYQTIKSGSTPFSQKFTIKVSTKCKDIVDLSDAILLDTIHTEDGTKPISLTGSLNLGEKDPGDEASFNVLFDITGLEPGIYSPVLKIVGIYKDNLISTEINFQLTVTTSSSPILTNTPINPVYTIPDVVATGQEFEIVVSNLNPNYQPQLQLDPSLLGIKVNREPSTWKWTGSINKSGEYQLSVGITYLGGPIGPIFNKLIKVTQAGSLQSSGLLKFDLFPSLEQINAGEEIAILVRDQETNNIVEATLYLDGVKIEGNKLIAEMGKKYCVSAVAPTYNTADTCFEVQLRTMSVTISPNGPGEGDEVTFSLADTASGQQINESKFFLNDMQISSTHTFTTEGVYTIQAKADGYQDMNFTVDVKAKYGVAQAPPKLDKGDENMIKLTKSGPWKVQYLNEKGETIILNEGNSDSVIFTPKKAGTYTIIAGDQQLVSYTLKGFSFSSLFGGSSDGQSSGSGILLIIVLVIVIAVIILILVLVTKGNRKVGFGVPSLPTESFIEEM